MIEKIQGHGLIIPEITPDNYILGGFTKLKGVVINASGDWTSYLPEKEWQQKRGIETQACTSFATLSCLETLIKFKGKTINYSDRYLAIVGNIDPYRGADPHFIAETIRKTSGCLEESLLPFSEDILTVEDYYKPKPMTSSLLAKGNEWYNEYYFGHEYVFQGGTPQSKRLALKEAITKGTIAVSVYAWVYENGKYVKPAGVTDNHWTTLVAVKDDKYIVFDSYDGFIKELDPLYDFAIAKVYYLNPAQPKLSYIQWILNSIQRYIDTYLRPKVNEVAPIPIDQEPPPKVEPTVSKINTWAKAIQFAEGFSVGSRSFRNNNPGNLRSPEKYNPNLSPYMISLGATAMDSGNFCVFPSYDIGFKALCQFLTDACTNQIAVYKDVTLEQFTNTYALPESSNYLNSICVALKVERSVKISTFI